MYTKDFDRDRLKPFRQAILEVYGIALRGMYWEALTLNGLIHSVALGLSLKTTLEALKAGALAAGLSGTGPAVAAVCHGGIIDDVKARWSDIPGEVLITSVNNSKAEGDVCADEG